VVPTIDVLARDGEVFLVMEYVQGESLANLLREAQRLRRPVPPEIVSAIVVGVLSGLHAAHEVTSERGEPLNIVHRAVSPQNILLGVDGIPRLLGFAATTHATHAGLPPEDIWYMPPEQIRGDVGRTTDIYASGAVLWEGFTGMPLFFGESEAEIVAKVLDPGRAIDPPSKYAPGLSPAVDDLVLRALARDPSKRFSTARDMARALEKCLPLVSASDVGDWVEATASSVLARHAERIASIESSSSSATTSAHGSEPFASRDPTWSSPSCTSLAPAVTSTRPVASRRPELVVAVASGIGLLAITLVVVTGVLGTRHRSDAKAGVSSVVAASPPPATAAAPPAASSSTSGAPEASASTSATTTGTAAPGDPSPRQRELSKRYGRVLDTRH
jgi:serine/threonine-protein kinase